MLITNGPVLSAEEKEPPLHRDGPIDPQPMIDALDSLELLHLTNSHLTVTLGE
jgi:hypothetical protein